MGYGNITPKYNLPSPSLGDTLDGSSELRKVQTIENQLFGAIRMHSGGHGIIRNGQFIVVTGSGGQYSVICFENKAAGKPAIECFMSQIYCYSDSPITWTGLSNNTTYYLYVRLVEAGSDSSSRLNKQIISDFNTTGIIPSDGLLIAVVNINEPGNSVVIDNPPSKITLPVLGDHMVNNNNPHTPFLWQDDIVCSGLTVLDYIRYRSLQVDSLVVSGNGIISGNITVLGSLTISGNIYNQGNVVYNELQVQNLNVPGNLIAASLQVTSGFDCYGPSTFRKPIILTSGNTIDGFDPSEAIPLITGQNADHLHSHILGSISPGVKLISLSPEYPNTIASGLIESGIFAPVRFNNLNCYQWFALTSGAIWLTSRFTLPQDFESFDRIKLTNGIGYVGSGNNITLSVLDKDLNPVTVTGGVLANTQMTQSPITLSGGQAVPNQPITVINRMFAVSGVGTFLGDLELYYVPVNGEKIMFDWNSSGIPASKHFDGLRVAPYDIRVERILASQYVALSGATVLGLNVGNSGSEPSNIFATTPKPILNVGANGAYFLSTVQAIQENTVITGGQLISVSADLIASGIQNLSVQLIGHRI